MRFRDARKGGRRAANGQPGTRGRDEARDEQGPLRILAELLPRSRRARERHPRLPNWRRSCPSVFLIDLDASEGAGFRFRFCGASIATRYGRDLTDESFLALWSPTDAGALKRDLCAVAFPLDRHGRRRDGGDRRRRLRLASRCCFCRLPARPARPAQSARWCASAATTRRTASARASSPSRCGRFAFFPDARRDPARTARRRPPPSPPRSRQNAPPLRPLDRRHGGK